MSVKRSGANFSQSRINTSTLKSIDSSVQSDFDGLLKAFATGVSTATGLGIPYVLRGFTINTTTAIGSSAISLQMRVDNSGIFQGSSTGINTSPETQDTGGTFYVTDYSNTPVYQILDANTNPDYVVGGFAASTTNYVGVQYIRQLDDSTADLQYFWDVASNSQFSQVKPLARTLNYQIVISTTPFTGQPYICPIAEIVTGSSTEVISVTDCRPLFFSLGQGGQTPDLLYNFWTDTNPYTGEAAPSRTPNGTTETVNPTDVFSGGDKSIGSLKELINAILSVLKEIKGTTYWTSAGGGSGGGGSIVHLREDALNTVVTGSGTVSHNILYPTPNTPGRMNWSSDINLKLIGSRLAYTVLANASPSALITLNDNQVAYLALVRDVAVAANLLWTNGSPTVSSVGGASWTTSLLAGDFIRVATADDSQYYQIKSVDSASSVTLGVPSGVSVNYAGATSPATGDPSVYAYGTYQASNSRPSSQIQIADRSLVPFSDTTYWLFLRSDNGGSPTVYAHFFGDEMFQGESQNIGEGISQQNLQFIGAASAADSSPSYSTKTITGPTSGNSFVGDGNSLTKASHVLDVEANNPLRPHANVGTANQNLYFEASSTAGGDGTNKTVGPIAGSVWFNLAGSSLDFSVTQPAGTPSGNFSIDTITPVNNNYYAVGFSLQSDGKIRVAFSSGDATLVNVQTPTVLGNLFPSTNSPIGYVYLQYLTASEWRTAGSASAIIENAQIFRFGSGAGGQGSNVSPYNDDLISLLFRGKITDTFTEPSSASTSTVESSTTTAAYNGASQIYQISYDASKTVTGSGLTYTLSSAPAYTVGTPAKYDVLIVGSQQAVIDTIVGNTITLFTTLGTIAAPTACCVSQKVKSKDLYGTSFDGDSLSLTFSGASFTEFLVDYEDSTTPNDNIFDIASAPVVAWAASGDDAAYTNIGLRPTLQTTTAQSAFLPSTSTAFYVRFFANKTSGSGTVNLINYRAYLQKDPTSSYGAQNSSYGVLAGYASATNMALSTVGGKTRVVLPYQYPVGVSAGQAYGSLDVYINGQIIPRYISGAATPSSYYTEVNNTTIDLNADYSGYPAGTDIEIIQRVTVTDTSTQNTSNIAVLQSNSTPKNIIINGAFDINQVSPGVAATINTATASNIKFIDQWSFITAGSTVKNLTALQSTTVPTVAQSGFATQNSLVMNINTGIASFAATDVIRPFRYAVEGYDFEAIHQQVFTLSFWVYASVAGTYNVSFKNSASDRSYVTTFVINSPTTWEFKTITLTGDQSGTWLLTNGVGINISIGAYAGSNFTTSNINTWQGGEYHVATGSTNWMATSSNALYIANVALVKGAYGYAANQYYRSGSSIQAELAACQRYYSTSYASGTIPATATAVGSTVFRNGTITGANRLTTTQLKVSMRVAPTVTIYSTNTGTAAKIYDLSNTADVSAGANDIGTSSFTTETTGSVASNSLNFWHYVADARL